MKNPRVDIFFSPRPIHALKMEQVEYKNTMTGQKAYSIGNTIAEGGVLKQTQILIEPNIVVINFL